MDKKKTITKQAKDKVVSSITTITSSIPSLKKRRYPQISTRDSSAPLRVAFICPYSMSIPGGVQKQVLLLSEQMRTRGIDARIIAPCDGAPLVDYIIPVGTTRALKSNGSLAPIADDASSASYTMDAISMFRPDVLHLHEPLVPGPTATAVIGADTAMVATFHSASEDTQALKYFRHPARGAISRVHIRTAVSQEAKLTAQRYLPGEYEIIPNCVEVDEISKMKKWPSSKPAVLFVGRHEERKGLRYLIDAWMDSDKLQKNAVLWVAGSGEETDELIEKTKDINSISFVGRVQYSELFSRMRTAYVVVAPALYGESFGIVLLEAMAANACVVATNIAGYRDVARDGIEALLVDPGDSDSLRVGIESIMDNKDLRHNLQHAGKTRANEFSVVRIADYYIDSYQRAISIYKQARLS